MLDIPYTSQWAEKCPQNTWEYRQIHRSFFGSTQVHTGNGISISSAVSAHPVCVELTAWLWWTVWLWRIDRCDKLTMCQFCVPFVEIIHCKKLLHKNIRPQRAFLDHEDMLGYSVCFEQLWMFSLCLNPFLPHNKHCQSSKTVTTRSSAIAERPRDASCQLKSCQLPRNSAETTYTTSPYQIGGMKLEI